MLLDDTVALVTGGARGIGLEVARRYAEEGARVVLADVDAAANDLALETLTGHGLDPGRLAAVQLDVTDPDSTARAADEAEDRFGPVTCVVANAGVLHLAPTLDIELASWQRVLDVNLTGAFLTVRELGRRMRERGAGGRIIFTASLFAVRGGVENAAYSASKFGMLGLMESLAAELAPHAITVNAVCPGQIRTEMMEQLSRDRAALLGSTPEAELDRLRATIPLGRLGEPSEIADVYVYLASRLSRYTTGQALVVDGGIRVG